MKSATIPPLRVTPELLQMIMDRHNEYLDLSEVYQGGPWICPRACCCSVIIA